MRSPTITNHNEKEKFFKRTELNNEIQEQEILVKCKQTKRFREEYLTFFQGEFMDKRILLKDIKEVLGTRSFLLFWLLNNMDKTNSVRESRAEICKATGIDKTNISKHLKALTSVKMITIKNHNIVFNPEFVYKGQTKNHSNIF